MEVPEIHFIGDWLLIGCVSFIGTTKFLNLAFNRKSKIEVQLNLESDSSVELYTKVKNAVKKSPKVIAIEIIGIGHISQDIVLAIWELVQEAKKSGVRFTSAAKSSLYDGSVLLLLLGDAISVRSTAFFQIDSLERLKNNDWSDDESRKSMPINEPAWVTNYREVFKIMNQFLPVEELADKRVPMIKLQEYGLLNDEKQEKSFQDLFSLKKLNSESTSVIGNAI